MDTKAAIKALLNPKARKLHGEYIDKLGETIEALVALHQELDLDMTTATLVGDIALTSGRLIDEGDKE
jgi:hypothetical protein